MSVVIGIAIVAVLMFICSAVYKVIADGMDNAKNQTKKNQPPVQENLADRYKNLKQNQDRF